MLGVSYAGPRSYPCIEVRGKQFLMEHKAFVVSPSMKDPEHCIPEEALVRAEEFSRITGAPRPEPGPVEIAPFWLFGFDSQQVEVCYQGPCPLRDTDLARIVPALREAVRDELATGHPQHRTLE